MPRFFMNVHNGNGLTVDEEGVDYPDLEAARRAAVKAARGIMADEIKGGLLSLDSYLEVLDEKRVPIFKLRFGEAVRAATVKDEGGR